jgi:hypothetical protein
MAGAVTSLTFATRQADIAVCGVVNLHFIEGTCRAEYVSGTELHNDGVWAYQFLIQEEDLPGSMTLADATNCNIVAPYWTCLTEDEEAEEEEACAIRTVRCFDSIPTIETLTADDRVAIFRHDIECDTFCLAMMDPYTFAEQTESPIP